MKFEAPMTKFETAKPKSEFGKFEFGFCFGFLTSNFEFEFFLPAYGSLITDYRFPARVPDGRVDIAAVMAYNHI